MKVLIVHAHPDPQSFSHAIVQYALSGLQKAGHFATVLDLYALDYIAGPTMAEHRAYETDQPVLDPMVADHVRLVQQSDALIFIYPTWWSTMPAILKGWLERTMVIGVAFNLHPRTRRVMPALTHLQYLIGISTYGSPRWYMKVVNDNGRRTVCRTLRLSSGRKTKTKWLGLYELNNRNVQERNAFLEEVSLKMEKLS